MFPSPAELRAAMVQENAAGGVIFTSGPYPPPPRSHREEPSSQQCACPQVQRHAEIDVPTIDTIRTSPFREEIEGEWQNMLSLPTPPTAAALRRLLVDSRRCLRLARRHAAHRPAPPSLARHIGPRLGGTQGHHLVEARRPTRVTPLCRSQPPEGRHRLPSRERAMGITASRAVLTALHPRRQPDPLRRQRPWSASELPSRLHRRHPSNDGDLPAQVPSRILHICPKKHSCECAHCTGP